MPRHTLHVGLPPPHVSRTVHTVVPTTSIGRHASPRRDDTRLGTSFGRLAIVAALLAAVALLAGAFAPPTAITIVAATIVAIGVLAVAVIEMAPRWRSHRSSFARRTAAASPPTARISCRAFLSRARGDRLRRGNES